MTKTKNGFFLALLLCVLLAGCRKSGPSVTGTWNMSKWRFTVDSVDVTIIDVNTTYVQNDSTNTIAIRSNGTFVMTRHPQKSFVGPYKLAGNTIVFSDTTVGDVITDTLISLTDHSMILSKTASSRYINPHDSLDTRMLTYHDTYTLVR